jgi:hypothetical protein
MKRMFFITALLVRFNHYFTWDNAESQEKIVTYTGKTMAIKF